MRKIKVAFILSEFGLPVPAKMGGAIETLMTMLLEQNEIEGEFEFIFISPGEQEEKTEYSHAVCYSCRSNPITPKESSYLGQKVQYKLKQYFPGIFIKVNKYYKTAGRIVRRNKADFIIGEGVLHEQFIYFLRICNKENIATHIHHQYRRTALCDKIFGRTIAISQYIADKWNENSTEQSKNTYILKNCIDKKKFDIFMSPDQRLQMRKKIGFDKDDFVVLFCGRIVEEKGVRELIDAVMGIRDEKVKLLLIGSDGFAKGNRGKYAAEIEELVRQNKEKIVNVGYIKNEVLYQYYKSADLQVVPSIWEEPAGLVVLEGMMSKIPLIITRSGGMVEYVNEKYSKIIPKDEHLVESIRRNILELQNNPYERRSMAEGAYEWAKQFTKQKYYEDFCDIMNKWQRK